LIDAGDMINAIQYTMQYELLRSHVIGTMGKGDIGGQARGIGLALLLSAGMPGWLRGVEGVLRASLAPQRFDSSDPTPHKDFSGTSAVPVWLSSVQRYEVTSLLASMVLSTRPLAAPIFNGGM
jgi:hypothetical protein